MSQLSVSSITSLVGDASSAVKQASTEPLKAVLSTEAPDRLMAIPVPVGSYRLMAIPVPVGSYTQLREWLKGV